MIEVLQAPKGAQMKLEEGKNYWPGFLVLLALWAVFGFTAHFLDAAEPGKLGFAAGVLCQVTYQAYSGVCLDASWTASLSRSTKPKAFWLSLVAQSAIAAVVVYDAFT